VNRGYPVDDALSRLKPLIFLTSAIRAEGTTLENFSHSHHQYHVNVICGRRELGIVEDVDDCATTTTTTTTTVAIQSDPVLAYGRQIVSAICF